MRAAIYDNDITDPNPTTISIPSASQFDGIKQKEYIIGLIDGYECLLKCHSKFGLQELKHSGLL